MNAACIKFSAGSRCRLHGLICAWLLAGTNGFAQNAILDRVNQLELKGDFKAATGVLKQALEPAGTPAGERKTLEFELDRLDRIKKDFPYTRETLFAELKQSVSGLTEQEFDQWIAEGRFDSREIDGTRYFMSSSGSNLFFRYADLRPRRMPPDKTEELEKAFLDTCTAITRAAHDQSRPYVLPKRFHVVMSVSAKPEAASPGETIRAWLPIPRRYPFQTDFALLGTSSPVKHMDDEQSPIRSLYLEQTAGTNGAEFRAEYDYTAWGVRFDVDPSKVRPSDPNDEALKPFVREAPHVVFTPEIKALSAQIAGGETNPYLKAKKFYDWIADHIKYSYAIEYSTIRNISDYCRSNGFGDCGQEALLFITLCRLNGIPARWQSGWNTFPGAKTIHDWSEIYIAPYGWMPVDPYMGIYSMRYITSLTPQQKREIRDFYFGGLDQYRMAANSDHNQPLVPAKRTMRSDDVDFQRGELEAGERNIYFDKYSWKLERTEIKPARAD